MPRKNRKSRAVRRLGNKMEALESRTLLAGDVTAALTDQILQISGSEENDDITVIVDSAEQLIEVVDGDERVETFPLQELETLNVEMGAGDDQLRIIDPEMALEASGVGLRIDGGSGEDTILFVDSADSLSSLPELRSVSDLAGQLASIVSSMEQISTQSLTTTAEQTVTTAREQIGNVAQQLQNEVENHISDAEQFLNEDNPQLVGSFNELLAEIGAVSERLVEMTDETTATISEITDNLEEAADAEQLDENEDGEAELAVVDDLLTSINEITDEGDRLVDSAGMAADQIESTVTDKAIEIREESEEILDRSMALFEASGSLQDTLEVDIENTRQELTQLSTQLINALEDYFTTFRELTDRVATTAAENSVESSSRAGSCEVHATHFSTNVSVVIVPFSTQSWSIAGTTGTDFIWGSLADDQINADAGFDIVFGWGGNDDIHGGADSDLLFGEFVVDIPAIIDNDCIHGDEGTDFLFGDNLSLIHI